MIREYSKRDKSGIIDLLRKNTPEYFDFSEESDFEKVGARSRLGSRRAELRDPEARLRPGDVLSL